MNSQLLAEVPTSTAVSDTSVFTQRNITCTESTWVPHFEPDLPPLRLFWLHENLTTPYLIKNDRIEIKRVYLCSA